MTRRLPPRAKNRRLPLRGGEWIDRDRTVTFTVDGRKVQGFAGDTLTSAQLAAGEIRLGRSFKYHRLRGPLSLANHDINALYQTDTETNIRGDITPPQNGGVYRATNVKGTVIHDRQGFMQWLAPFLPVGFYYKAFFKPKALFPFWEKLIRKKAGLGVVDPAWPGQRVAKRYAFTDVLVIGAGPSGMSAALAAAAAGASVLLVDENPHIGGSLDYQFAGDETTRDLSRALKGRIADDDRITVLTSAEASGYYKDHWVPVTTAQGITKVRAKAVIVAAGVFEQPAVFHGNDVPGVMLASAAQRLIARFAVKPAADAVLLVANEDGYRAALDMIDAGVRVQAIADLGDAADRGALAVTARDKGIRIYERTTVYETRTRKGSLAGVTLVPLGADDALDLGTRISVDCDGLMMSVGWAPAAALLYQAGGQLAYDHGVGQFAPVTLPDGLYAAGRVNGIFDLDEKIADGTAVGRQAAAHAKGADDPAVSRPARGRVQMSHPYPIFDHPKGQNYVDMDEDLQLKDLRNAALEGFDNIELMKRYSTIGMGPSQGKHSNMNAIRILAKHIGKSIDDTGSTTARPFFHPVPLSHLAGRRFRPERRTPMHDFHVRNNAVMMEAGMWARPEYYESPGLTRDQAIRAEVTNVRERVGLIDVSTLGKLEVFGTDAGLLLDRLYTMRMSTIVEGMTRYALMTDESGVIVDDGVAIRHAAGHFYVTTTSGTSDSAYRTIQRHIIEWGLDVEVINRTGQLAAINLAGPHARDVLAPHTDIDLGEDAFPYLGARTGSLFGHAITLIRVGFVGELGYEIHLPAGTARALWDDLMAAGGDHGIRPFGVEAQRLLRLEKGHVIVGQDTDGLTNPYEAAMSWAVHMKKDFFVGKRSLAILKPKCRRTLRGFTLDADYDGPSLKECHLVIHAGDIAGRVTSVSHSPTLGCVIGLAYVDDAMLGDREHFDIRVDDGTMVTARVSSLPFYDPEGARQKGSMAS